MGNVRSCFALLALIAVATLAAAQQISARAYPERPDYAVGEPIFIVVELTDTGTEAVQIDDGPCGQSFESNAPATSDRPVSLYGCSPSGIAGDCLGSFATLQPGQKLVRRFLLPENVQPDSPGNFNFAMKRRVNFYAADGSHKFLFQQEVSAAFTVKTVPGSLARLQRDYAPILASLRSPDLHQRVLAVQAVTEHPQAFLEPLILEFSGTPQTVVASIAGLKKLGSKRAKARLAELTGRENPEYVRQPATTALAELDDAEYCSVMLNLVRLRTGYTASIAARGAGLLCGGKAIPELLQSLRPPKPLETFEVAYALGNTGSRDAVPILISLLRNSDSGVQRAATDALYTLTHAGPEERRSYEQWWNWWALEGKSAKVFRPTECP